MRLSTPCSWDDPSTSHKTQHPSKPWASLGLGVGFGNLRLTEPELIPIWFRDRLAALDLTARRFSVDQKLLVPLFHWGCRRPWTQQRAFVQQKHICSGESCGGTSPGQERSNIFPSNSTGPSTWANTGLFWFNWMFEFPLVFKAYSWPSSTEQKLRVKNKHSTINRYSINMKTSIWWTYPG